MAGDSELITASIITAIALISTCISEVASSNLYHTSNYGILTGLPVSPAIYMSGPCLHAGRGIHLPHPHLLWTFSHLIPHILLKQSLSGDGIAQWAMWLITTWTMEVKFSEWEVRSSLNQEPSVLPCHWVMRLSLWNWASNETSVHPPDDARVNMKQHWNDTDGENRMTRKTPCPSPTWPGNESGSPWWEAGN